MQELFNLYYLYEYMANHTYDEEHIEYSHLKNYVVALIKKISATE